MEPVTSVLCTEAMVGYRLGAGQTVQHGPDSVSSSFEDGQVMI